MSWFAVSCVLLVVALFLLWVHVAKERVTIKQAFDEVADPDRVIATAVLPKLVEQHYCYQCPAECSGSQLKLACYLPHVHAVDVSPQIIMECPVCGTTWSTWS